MSLWCEPASSGIEGDFPFVAAESLLQRGFESGCRAIAFSPGAWGHGTAVIPSSKGLRPALHDFATVVLGAAQEKRFLDVSSGIVEELRGDLKKQNPYLPAFCLKVGGRHDARTRHPCSGTWDRAAIPAVRRHGKHLGAAVSLNYTDDLGQILAQERFPPGKGIPENRPDILGKPFEDFQGKLSRVRIIEGLGVKAMFATQCPSSKHLGRLSLFYNRGSGSSWFDVKPLCVDGSSGGYGLSVF